jgi:kynureninase
MPITRDHCLKLDAADPLGPCRARFRIDEGINYLDGNSLGALPQGVAEHVVHVVEDEWGKGLIRSWNAAGWYVSPARVGAKLAPLLGAEPHEVTVTEAISINLFKLLVAAARMRPKRKTILAEHGNFPSDNHIVDSVARLLGLEARFLPASEIAAAIDEQTCVATLSHINYRTAEVQDMAKVTAAAHAKGALIVWDLAHSSGAVDVKLDETGADFAVGCGYKFLNGGPGAPSHIFVAERHLGSLDQPLTGWFGHAEPFRFDDGYRRAEGIRHMLCSTPQMLSMAAFEKALDAFAGVSMSAVEHKGRALGDLMIALYDERLAALGCGLATLRDGARRGNHVSLTHEHGYAVMQALIQRGVIGDFRAPDVMRFGFGPLYVRFVDVYDAVIAIADILGSGSFKDAALAERQAVT